jgi:hypothetical protein
MDNSEAFEEKINIILRQTDLTYEEAKKYLENNEGDYMKALNQYFGVKKTNKKNLTINQQIYSEIRSVMDDAAHRFYSERENK